MATLGFSIDAAISELRVDVAVVLIVATALPTLPVDALSRALPGSRVSKGLQPLGGARGRSP